MSRVELDLTPEGHGSRVLLDGQEVSGVESILVTADRQGGTRMELRLALVDARAQGRGGLFAADPRTGELRAVEHIRWEDGTTWDAPSRSAD